MQVDEVLIYNWAEKVAHRGIRRDGTLFTAEQCNTDQIEHKEVLAVAEGSVNPYPELERCGHCWPKQPT